MGRLNNTINSNNKIKLKSLVVAHSPEGRLGWERASEGGRREFVVVAGVGSTEILFPNSVTY